MSDKLPWDASRTETLVRLILYSFECPENMLASKIIRQTTSTIKSDKVWTCLLPVGGEESGEDIPFQSNVGRRREFFTALCLHSSSQLKNTTTQWLIPLVLGWFCLFVFILFFFFIFSLLLLTRKVWRTAIPFTILMDTQMAKLPSFAIHRDKCSSMQATKALWTVFYQG